MLGERLKALRKSKRMSRDELGKRLGVTGAAVYKWETGKAEPNVATLQALSEMYGVTVDELLSEGIPDVVGFSVMARAYQQMTREEREKYLAVGRALFAHAFGEDEP